MLSSMRKICGFTSSCACACACAEYHPGLCSPLIHSVVFNDSVSGSEGPEQIARMRRLIWASATANTRSQVFEWHGPCMIDTSQSWRRRLLARWHREKWQKNYQYYRVYILRNGIRAKRSYKNKLFFRIIYMIIALEKWSYIFIWSAYARRF